MSSAASLFQPFALKSLKLANRIVMAPNRALGALVTPGRNGGGFALHFI
jgi:2,4-dienoyl-CoA reductase-like NADH-dependent reductase (Old Yellow Enzyme family)